LKNWPYLFGFLYLVIIAILAWPVTVWCFVEENNLDRTLVNAYIYVFPFLAVILGATQILLFTIQVNRELKRLTPKRSIVFAIILGGLILGVMLALIITNLVLIVMTESIADELMVLLLLIIPVLFWVFWSLIFYNYYRKNGVDFFLTKLLNRFLQTSILGLLVAVPSHIIFRGRNDCCAPFFSYLGIMTGIAVMLLALGPGIIFLYLKRKKLKSPRKQN
jgi:hypothetical protein